ncbi:DUF3331 domain-containing protein [Paraburkholderia sediminicola]
MPADDPDATSRRATLPVSAYRTGSTLCITIMQAPAFAANGMRITILESSEDHLLVRWVESGKCHFGEQRWRLRVTSRLGICALSGRHIRRGQTVYRQAERPPNHAAMIPPEALDQCR